MPYFLSIPDPIGKQVSRLSPVVKRKIRNGLDEIVLNPTSGKALTENLNGFRAYKLGSLRIVYQIQNQNVVIAAIGPRKTIYEKVILELRRR